MKEIDLILKQEPIKVTPGQLSYVTDNEGTPEQLNKK